MTVAEVKVGLLDVKIDPDRKAGSGETGGGEKRATETAGGD